MKTIPDTENAPVLRTDFSDEAAWEAVSRAITQPVGAFRAYVAFISDTAFSGVSADELPSLIAPGAYRPFIFVVDHLALSEWEHPILVVDLVDEPGRSFRVIPAEMWAVENNLSLANMDWEDFADSVDADGVFRGFPEA